MAHQESLSQWIETVSIQMKDLAPHHATIMALWSFGMVIVQSCGITSVAALLVGFLEQKENTVRQRLRESTYDSEDQRGKNRTSLDVTTCFAPLLRWILAWWDSDEQRLALANGCEYPGPTLHGPGDQCGLSRVCHPSGLARVARVQEMKAAA